MTDLYTGDGPATSSRSGQGADARPYAPSESGDVQDDRERRGGTGGVYRADQRARVVGHSFDQPKKGLFRYDIVHGRGGNIQFAVSRDDRMSPEEGGNRLHQLHEFFGVATEKDEILFAFDRALMFCHTLNSGSVLVPGRASFGIPGVNAQFDFARVRDFLGVDVRRFFRAFADFTTEVNKQVIEEYARNPHDSVVEENYGLMMAVAADRNLHRYPYLAHDSADACLKLNLSERFAVNASKQAVISSTPNAVDGTKSKQFIKSADGLNSTNGQTY